LSLRVPDGKDENETRMVVDSTKRSPAGRDNSAPSFNVAEW
jgi:hypothetical protein